MTKANAFVKRITSLFLSLVFVLTTFAFADFMPQAATKWTPIASSDFSKANGSSNSKMDNIPTYNGMGNPMSWTNVIWAQSGEAVQESDAFYIPDGYMYLSGYGDNSTTPLANLNSFKLDFGFRFKDATIDGSYSSDNVTSADTYTFLKLGVLTNLFDDTDHGLSAYSYFAQDAYGQVYSGDPPAVGTNGSATAVATSSDNLSAGINYHYIAEFTGDYCRVYITDDDGTVVQEVLNTTDETFIGHLRNLATKTVSEIKIGDSKKTQYFRGLEYRNITFYTADTNYKDPSPSADADKYLYAYFVGNSDGGEKLRYAVSDDGINFHTLNRGLPVWDPNKDWNIQSYPDNAGIEATKHVRDPYIFKGQNGKYYVLATDLNTVLYGFSHNSKLLVWELDRLTDIETTTPWTIDAHTWFSQIVGGDLLRSWAPQAIWDPVKEEYMLYWSMGFVDGHTIMYYIYTPDFKTFDGLPKRLVSATNDHIDGDITYNEKDKLYYLWYKNENTASIAYATSPTCNGPYTNTQPLSADVALEGPQVHQLTDGTYVLMADAYANGFFNVYKSDTLNGFTDTVSSNINYLHPRHGSVVRISTAEYNELISKYKIKRDDIYELYFTGETSAGSNDGSSGDFGWVGGVADPSEHNFSVSSGTYYSASEGTLTLKNCNVFAEQDAQLINMLTSDAFTISVKHTLTDSAKNTSDFTAVAVGGVDGDFIRLAEDGTFYVDGVAAPQKADIKPNVENKFDIIYNNGVYSLMQNDTFVTGVYDFDRVEPATNGTLYIGLGWSDATTGGRITGTYSDFSVSPDPIVTGHENDITNEYIDGVVEQIADMQPASFDAVPKQVDDPVTEDAYSNYVYADGTSWSGNGSSDAYTGIGRIQFKLAVPRNNVLVYDGVKEVRAPVTLESKRNNEGGSNHFIDYFYLQNSTYFELKSDWSGYGTDRNKWAGKTQTTATFDHTNSNKNNSGDHGDRNGASRFWWNILYYTGTGNTDTYYEHESNIGFQGQTEYRTTSKQYKDGPVTSVSDYYIINYKPIRDIIVGDTKVPNTDYSIKDFYANVVKGHEHEYTLESLEHLDKAIFYLLNCDPNNFNYSGNVQSAVEKCAASIKTAIDEFNKIKLVKIADFTQLDAVYAEALEALESGNYTATSKAELKKVMDSLVYAPDDEDPYRPTLGVDKYQDAVDAEKAKLRAAVEALDSLYDFTEYDAFYKVVMDIINTLDTEDQQYTTDTINALKAAVDAAYYQPNDDDPNRNDVGVSKDGSKIESERETITSARDGLLAIADFTGLDAAFKRADELLKGLNNESPVYTEASVQNLIDAIQSAGDYTALSAKDRRNRSAQEYQTVIDGKAVAISNAIAALVKPAESVEDFSAYDEVVAIYNNVDQDIYEDESNELESVLADSTSALSGDTLVYSSNSDEYNINTFKSDIDQTSVDSVITTLISELNEHIRKYKVEIAEGSESSFAENGITFGNNGKSTTDEAFKQYTATYNSTAKFTASTEETAWYMEYTSETTKRAKQFQKFGESFETQVIGNIKLYAVQRSDAKPNKVTIIRDYGSANSNRPLVLIDFTSDSYVLPEPAAIPGYTFDGYYINDAKVESTAEISEDTIITAKYNVSAKDCAVTVKGVNGNSLYNDTVAYNTKIVIKDNNAYAWVEETDSGDDRLFFVGSSFTYYANDKSVVIKGITREQFTSASYSVPALNPKKSGVMQATAGEQTRAVFNGQLVQDPSGEKKVLEYGFLIGKALDGGELPDENKLVLANAGKNEAAGYSILRAKSTQLVGANQFSIFVNNLSGQISYRGYVTYQSGSGADTKISTVYTDVVIQNIE